jgi:hypothetical protein
MRMGAQVQLRSERGVMLGVEAAEAGETCSSYRDSGRGAVRSLRTGVREVWAMGPDALVVRELSGT